LFTSGFRIVEAPRPADQRHANAVAAKTSYESPVPHAAHPNSFLIIANALCARGQPALAIVFYRKVIALDPNNARAHNNIGLALQQLGKIEDAVPHHQRALELSPELAEAHAGLGNAHRLRGRLEDALRHYLSAVAMKPDYAAAHNDAAGVLHLLGRTDDAIGQYRRAIAVQSNNADAHYNLANLLGQRGRGEEALGHYAKALEIQPVFAEARNNMANVLQTLGRHEEAVAQYEAAVGLKPRFADAYHNLGKAYFALNRYDYAIAAYEKALAIDASKAMVHNDLGAAHLVLGHLPQAYAAFAAAVARAPRNAAIHLNLASLARFTPGDVRLAALEKLAEEEPSLSDDGQIALNFALGKAYGDLDDNERSFKHLITGNALKRRHTAYDEAATLDEFARMRTAFTPALMQARRGCGDFSRVPVFIVGMPRSGSTLLEQILASHSRVFGAGEINDFAKVVASLPAASENLQTRISALSDDDLRHLGQRYVESITAKSPRATRIIDKMLSNFAYVGFIHLALPNARIIHACRDPVDTCLSCFSLLFGDDQPATYDLAEVGRYYRAYAALMRHWQSVLPAGVMLDIRYEDVVADVEEQARRLIAHCGLEWEDRCLSFHETQRPVHTASVTQVRRPIYRSSVGRWRPPPDLLRPLLDALAGGANESTAAAKPSFRREQRRADNTAAQKPPSPLEHQSFAEALNEIAGRARRTS
jgi:tetratricopeptide (TPR) repeat protein